MLFDPVQLIPDKGINIFLTGAIGTPHQKLSVPCDFQGDGFPTAADYCVGIWTVQNSSPFCLYIYHTIGHRRMQGETHPFYWTQYCYGQIVVKKVPLNFDGFEE